MNNNTTMMLNHRILNLTQQLQQLKDFTITLQDKLLNLESNSDNDLLIWVSGVKARAYIGDLGAYSSTRIWIKFEEPHSLMGERFNPTEDSEHGEFMTKYFYFDSPGHLVWGKMDENVWILEHRK